jgi:NADPH:quinone reductase-like Zn-dependent oxidoreductase
MSIGTIGCTLLVQALHTLQDVRQVHRAQGGQIVVNGATSGLGSTEL